jgi:diguanylate cyclase (GGDEF)-like protein
MSDQLDATERMVRPLSDLLGKSLRVAREAGTDDETLIRYAGQSILSVAGALSVEQRRALGEILDIVRQTELSALRISEMEARVTQLARENLELAVKNSMLAEVSARDSLTGLYNRWFVMEKIESEINRSLRHGSPMALLMLDIDHFKTVNDTYGHPAGDTVLQTVARLLKESCRVYDVPGRYGGEEFCLVLPETALISTPNVAERIRHRLETTQMEIGGTASVVVTASIGIAGIEGGSAEVLSPAVLIDRADRALYSAKNSGRNQIAMWHSSGARPVETSH